MKNFNRLVLSVVLPIVVASIAACSSSKSGSISGKIKGAEGKVVYLEQSLNNKIVRTDSSVIAADGSFSILPEHALDMNYYWLRVSPRDFVILITDSTEKVEVNGEMGKLAEDVEIKGSENTELLRDLEKGCNGFFDKEEEALKQLQNPSLAPEQQSQYRDQVIGARKERAAYVKKWLESNSSTPVAIAALQMLDPQAEGETYKKVMNDLEKTFAHSIHFKMLKQQVESLNRPAGAAGAMEEEPGVKVAVGRQAPEIALPDPSGKIRRLSDLKGKTVLIDFWASWCGPCRRENPNVVGAYKDYKKDGFEVMSVSLDRSADLWKGAIEKDGLIWPNHVSDLKNWDSQAAADYGVHSIPFPVLVDKDGKVIAFGNNVRGPMLEEHLKQIYGH